MRSMQRNRAWVSLAKVVRCGVVGGATAGAIVGMAAPPVMAWAVVFGIIGAIFGLAFGAIVAIPLAVYFWIAERRFEPPRVALGIRRCIAITAFTFLAWTQPISPLHSRLIVLVIATVLVAGWSWWAGRVVANRYAQEDAS